MPALRHRYESSLRACARSRKVRAFSLVEALVALSLIGLASSTLFLATTAVVQSGNDALAQTIARGIAEQLIDEIVGQPYHERGSTPTAWPLGPEAGETSNPPKSVLFDDTDDYAGYSTTRPCDQWGYELGQGNGFGGLRPASFRLREDYFANWNVRVSVTYVDPEDPTKDLTNPRTSVVRAIRVQIIRNWDGNSRELVNLRRIVAYVPSIGS